jgi:hypothetical protein
MNPDTDHDALVERIHADLIDGCDEELAHRRSSRLHLNTKPGRPRLECQEAP